MIEFWSFKVEFSRNLEQFTVGNSSRPAAFEFTARVSGSIRLGICGGSELAARLGGLRSACLQLITARLGSRLGQWIADLTDTRAD